MTMSIKAFARGVLLLALLAGAAGSMIIKYVNSSYFWVCTSLSRMPLKSALLSFGGVTFVNGVVAMVMVYLLVNVIVMEMLMIVLVIVMVQRL